MVLSINGTESMRYTYLEKESYLEKDLHHHRSYPAGEKKKPIIG